MVKGKRESKKVVETIAEQNEVITNDDIELKSSDEENSGNDSISQSDSDVQGLSEAEDEEDSEHRIAKLKPKKREVDTTKKNKNDEYSSIIYVSRLPHGFHEKELSKYFSQFGDLKEVRLARNKKSGNSRHYGFIEFANKEDAQVAQETMNNYLLMGHLLQVRLLGREAKIEKLFKYRKRAFMETPIKKSNVELKNQAIQKQEERMAKLAQAGIDFKW